jgi:2-dehydropantoate 2-reductase
VTVAVLGPGGVGGLLAGALERAGTRTIVLARESTTERIARHGLHVDSVLLGQIRVRPRAMTMLCDPVDALIVATKADGLRAALERVRVQPTIVLPLLNGLDHIALLRERFNAASVVAGAIRVEANRPRPGVVVHTSPFLRVDMASAHASAAATMRALERAFVRAGVPARIIGPISAGAEAQVLWGKLVRLNALACMTSAYDTSIGEIRSTPALRAELVDAIEEAAAVARAEGASVQGVDALQELLDAHPTLGSSMQRDIAAGRVPELDAIAGATLRAAARHKLACPTIERLVGMVVARAGVPAPLVP